ncbi:membrane protein [Vibrio ishigakensis]|uniref:Membrane protein n=2 Tax=Vibrio ishigakensis TaxID=1481914 RepID=A0A0B8NMU7_9VIBR|nr:DUF805 domain-containing protein [Vibrio ishigakensis]GAM55361.1 membrane protein [Vibrio ishigakensis]
MLSEGEPRLNEVKMNLPQLLFSFEGRVGRKQFWIWNLCYYFGLALIGGLLAQISPGLAMFAIPIVLVILLIPDLAITAKRWHDREKSAWMLLLNIPLVVGRAMMPAGSQAMVAETSAAPVISIVALACGAWILIECGFLKGTEGKNRYGEPYA